MLLGNLWVAAFVTLAMSAPPPHKKMPVVAKESPSANASLTTTCKGAGDDVRVILNERTKHDAAAEAGSEAAEGMSCNVLYTKNGQTQSVASAQLETEYCDGVAAKMRITLEGAGFKCD